MLHSAEEIILHEKTRYFSVNCPRTAELQRAGIIGGARLVVLT